MWEWITPNHLENMKQDQAALPIFEEFVKSDKKIGARPFKVPENITLMVIDQTQVIKLNLAQKYYNESYKVRMC